MEQLAFKGHECLLFQNHEGINAQINLNHNQVIRTNTSKIQKYMYVPEIEFAAKAIFT